MLSHFSNHEQRITEVRFKNATTIFSSSLDGKCILWNMKNRNPSISYHPHKGPILGVCYDSHLHLAATCSTDKTVQLWKPSRNKFVSTSILHSDRVRGLDIHEINHTLATIADDNAIKIWDLETRKYSHMMAVPNDCWFRSVKISPCGVMVATAGQDRKVRVYDMRTRLPVQTFKDKTGVPRKISWHPDSYLLGAAYNDNRIQIFNICSGDALQVYDVHAAPVNDVAFHPTGMFLAAASDDQTIKILDLMLGKPLYTLIGHNARVRSVTFDIDGEMLASGDDDGHVIVWKTNLDTYNRERFVVKTSDSETMAAGGEIHDDKSIVIDQRDSEAYASYENVQLEKCFNRSKLKRIPNYFLPPSRIPVRCNHGNLRYEMDDY